MKWREWWIETHEIMKNKVNQYGDKSWPQVYKNDLGHTIKVIEAKPALEHVAKLEAEIIRLNCIIMEMNLSRGDR